jgi:hypothetical protein
MTPPIHQRRREAAADFIRSDDCPISVKMVLGYRIDPLAAAFARFEQQLLAGREG